ncbi:uncharacterized protein LOC114944336 [Nylanderia fulva]|uniref:uncharacterized protein LOC114944336 n=1 Tax=Nylanderia fulva TaxID=613905 RepID=UPI0010FB1FA7|nr:uncharacterized protein LOC114944336 [Nylanderia fulva]
MKTLLLVVCILTIAHAELTLRKIFMDHVQECRKGLPIQTRDERRRDVGLIFCAAKKVGGIDEKNKFVREKVLSNCADIISSDPVKIQKCKDICNTCIDEGLKVPGSNLIKTVKSIQCAISFGLMALMDEY